MEHIKYYRWMVFGVVLYFVDAIFKSQTIKRAYELHMVINAWDIPLQIITGIYTLVFLIIPLILFLSTTSILVDFNYETLIRLGSYKKWIYHSIKLYWLKISPYLFIFVFMSFYMMIGVPFSWNWSQLSISDSIYNNLHGLNGFFAIPFTALIFQITLLFLSFFLLHIIISIIYVLTKNKNFILICSGAFFIGGIIGFKLLPRNMAFLSPITYFSLTESIHSFKSPIISFSVIIVLITICLLYIQVLDLNTKNFYKTLKFYTPFLIYILLSALGISSAAWSLNPNKRTFLDVWLVSFRGSNPENFMLLPFSIYQIIFFGLLYLVNLYFYQEIDLMGYYKIIRFRNLEKWFWSWFNKILIMVFLLLLFLTGLSFLIGVILGMKFNLYTAEFSAPLIEVFYHFFINGFLQIVFYTLSLFIVSWISKESIYGLTLISVFMIFMLPIFNLHDVIPIGLNSFVYLVSYSPFQITAILLVANCLAYIVIKYLFTKSLKI